MVAGEMTGDQCSFSGGFQVRQLLLLLEISMKVP
jgi:hypothetical protein